MFLRGFIIGVAMAATYIVLQVEGQNLPPIRVEDVSLPPAACDHEPTEPYRAVVATLRGVQYLCAPPPGAVRLACTWPVARVRVLPTVSWVVTPELLARLERHENGHLNCGFWHP